MIEVLQDIHIGEESLDSIDFRYDAIGVPLRRGHDREFMIFIKNFGPPTSVSFDVDESLRDYIIFVERRPYVHNNLYVRLIARVPFSSALAAEGNFYVITGYGARKKSFRLRIGAGADGSISGAVSTSEAKWPEDRDRMPIYDDPENETSFRVREDWENIRRRNTREGKAYGTPYNYQPKDRRPGDPTYDKVPFPSMEGPDPSRARGSGKSDNAGKRRHIRTGMDIRGIIISISFVLFLALFFLYVLFTDVCRFLDSGQIWLLSAIIVGFAIFMIVLILNFFKTTVEE